MKRDVGTGNLQNVVKTNLQIAAFVRFAQAVTDCWRPCRCGVGLVSWQKFLVRLAMNPGKELIS